MRNRYFSLLCCYETALPMSFLNRTLVGWIVASPGLYIGSQHFLVSNGAMLPLTQAVGCRQRVDVTSLVIKVISPFQSQIYH